jgi:hypothetical protein
MKIEITKEELKTILYGLSAAADRAMTAAEYQEYEDLENDLITRFFSQSEYEV